ncbi:MAG: RHS repeat protein [Bacteroidetes bacterium]|nr:RHS repeat protein [Bacteroidota bacterium]
MNYDAAQNLAGITTDDGVVTKYTYDRLGNVTDVTNPYEKYKQERMISRGR